MERFIVPRRWQRGAWKSGIRTELDKKFPNETVKSVIITDNMKCYVTTEKSIMHDNPYHRIEFQAVEHHFEFEVVPRKCAQVMEG
jgi:hypothetical protein